MVVEFFFFFFFFFSDFNSIPTRITRTRRNFSFTRNHRSVNNNNLVPLHRTSTISNDLSTVHASSYNFTCSVINARSLRNKSLKIKDMVVDNLVDILAITATWLRRHGDDATYGEIYPSGYRFVHNP